MFEKSVKYQVKYIVTWGIAPRLGEKSAKILSWQFITAMNLGTDALKKVKGE